MRKLGNGNWETGNGKRETVPPSVPPGKRETVPPSVQSTTGSGSRTAVRIPIISPRYTAKPRLIPPLAQALLSAPDMPRRPRCQLPGTTYAITLRCLEGRPLLRPDTETNHCVEFWLADAQRQAPGVRVHSIDVMSNHMHLMVTDDHARLARFMGHFAGNLARDVNRLRGRRGPVFERRYAAAPVIDDQARVERMVYTLANPTRAGLVPSHRHWPGICLWAAGGRAVRRTCHRLRHGKWERACKRARGRKQAMPRRADFTDHATLLLSPMPGDDPEGQARRIARELARVEAEERKGRQAARQPFLGVARVLAQDPIGPPRPIEPSAQPLCHAGTLAAWIEFKAGWRRFVEAFRAASRALLDEGPPLPFPPGSFPPGRPLVGTA